MEKEVKEIKKADKDYYNEEVEVSLLKDDGKYKDDVVVICNGTPIKIPRGKPVKIKRKYAEILSASQMERMSADQRSAGMQTGD
jgi:hypothetical protein